MADDSIRPLGFSAGAAVNRGAGAGIPGVSRVSGGPGVPGVRKANRAERVRRAARTEAVESAFSMETSGLPLHGVPASRAIAAVSNATLFEEMFAATADDALGAVEEFLVEVQGASSVVRSGSAEECEVLQAQIDAALAGIDRVAGTTVFAGECVFGVRKQSAAMELPSIDTHSLGRVRTSDGAFTLADVRTGGALSLLSGDCIAAARSARRALASVAGLHGRVVELQQSLAAAQDAVAEAIHERAMKDAMPDDVDASGARKAARFVREQIGKQGAAPSCQSSEQVRVRALQLLQPRRS